MTKLGLWQATALSTMLLFSLGTMAADGEEWEWLGTIEMMGVKMPMGPTKRCQGPDTALTPPMEGECRFSDVKTQGATTKFTFVCAPPDAASGAGITIVKEGQIVSKYAMKTEDGDEGSVTMVGKKIGRCVLN